MRSFFTVLIFISCVAINHSNAQCVATPSQDCGVINAQGGVCSSNTIFCITDSVGFTNSTTSSFSLDSSYICWGDGSIDRFSGINPTFCKKHKYTFPVDSCVGGNGQIPITITLTLKKNCTSPAGGTSSHGILTPISIKFKPKARFVATPSNACVYEPITITNTSCPNDLSPTYTWNWGDGSPNTVVNSTTTPSHTYTSPGNYTITLTVTQGGTPNCGSSTYTQTVQVRPPTLVQPVVTLPNACAPGNFQPDVNSQNATGFSWSFNSGSGTITLPTDSQPVFNVTSPGTYGIHLEVTGCCNSPVSDCVWDTSLTLYSGPTTSNTPIPDACGSATINPRNYFNITGGTVNSYAWQFPGGNPSSSSSGAPGNITYSSPGTYIVTLTMNTPCGTKTLADTFVVSNPTTVSPAVTIPNSCAPLTFTPAVNAQNATGYLWSVTGGPNTVTNPTDPQPSISLNSGGTYTIQLAAQGCCTSPSSQCTWDTTVTLFQGVNLSGTPIPDFCGSAVITPSTSITSSGNITAYQWSFTGGSPNSSTSSNPGTVTYSSPGSYTVTLSATGPCGTQSYSDSFVVSPPTIVQPISNLSGICTPLSFNPVANSSSASSYQWNIISGVATISQPTTANPTVSVNSPGSITLGLNVTGCCTDPSSVCSWDTTLTVFEGPFVQSVGFPDYCNSATIIPTNVFSSGGAISSYAWSFPGGTPATSTASNPGSVQYALPGIYPVALTLSGTCGSTTFTDSVFIGTPPVAVITASDLYGCDSLTVTFNNSSPPNQTYSWSSTGGTFVNGSTSSDPQPSIFFSSPGSYGITVETNSAGCTPISSNFLLDIGEAPELIQSASIPDFCDSIIFIFSDYFQLTTNISDSGYAWNLYRNGTSVFSSSTSNPTAYQLINYGSYVATASVWNECDTILLTDTFTFSPPPTLQLPSDTSICSGTPSLILDANPSGGIWTWNGLTLPNSFDPNSTEIRSNTLVYDYGQLTCAVRDSFEVQVFGADIEAGNDTGLCRNAGVVDFIASPSGGYWTGGGLLDTLVATYDPSLNATGRDTLVYNLTEPTLGCLIRDTVFITVYSPTPGAVTIPDTACINDVLVFANNQPGTQAVWDFGDNTGQVSATQTTHAYTVAGNYQVSLFTTNQFGCKDTLTRQIEVAMPPNAVFVLDTNRGCAIFPLILTNQSDYYGATIYAWDFGDGQADTTYGPGTVYLDQGPGDSTIYHITLTASNGCGVATYTDSVTVYPIPVVDFGISMADSCSPATVNFANITTGQPEFYYWFVNDVFISSDSNLAPQVFVTDSLDSTYYVTLISTNFCGNDTLTKTVVIHPNTVTAFFNADLTYGCRPLTVNFSSFVGPDAVIQWDFGDGNNGIGYDITHTFDTAGIFTVWQYVDNYCGFDSISQRIEVLPQPDLSFRVDSVNCGNEVVQINNTSINLQGVYWDFGDGSGIDSIRYSPGHLYAQPGIYPITLVGVASGTGCKDTLTLNANVVSYPSASFLLDDNDGCAPHIIQLTTTSQNGNYFLWSLGNGDTLTGATTTYTFVDAGQYTLIHTVIDTNLCKDDTVFNAVNVYPVPIADFTLTQVSPCSVPTDMTWTNTSSGASNFTWDFGPFGTSTFQDVTLNFTEAANFNTTLIALNNFGCQDTMIRPVEVYDRVIADFQSDEYLACPDQPVQMINLSQHANAFTWDFGNATGSTLENPIAVYPNPGTYSLTLYANNDSVCFDSLTLSGYITIYPKPTSQFTFSEVQDTLVNPSGIFRFIDQSIDGYRWLWDFSDGKSDSVQNPIHRWYSNGTKTITQVTYNQYGCPDTSRLEITIDYLGSLFIPNAFAPGISDEETSFFIPKGVGLKEFLIEVFSPFGELLWYSDKLVDGQTVEKWDGKNNGIDVPQGAYVWQARAIFQNGNAWQGMRYNYNEPYRRSGSVNLIR